MEQLTARQQDVLEFIRRTIEEEGMPPTRAEISAAFGFASPNAAESHLKALAHKGAIVLESGSARGIKLTEPTGLPLVGRVAAGAPILAQEHIESRHNIDPDLFMPRAHFLLKVKGTSMVNVGIFDGDLLAVHRINEARNGQIIVARVDEEVTVKRLQRRKDGLIGLLPENADFEPIVVDPARVSFAIEGIAVGLIRDGFAR